MTIPFVIPEEEKEVMRERLKNSREENFKDWEEVKEELKTKEIPIPIT